jgi:ubiquinone/menaquinone biosynthesis C-methylase UbiE
MISVPQSKESAEMFRSSWSLYDTVVGHNYMFHREIQECIHDVLGARRTSGGYSLLDLGCGNARSLAACAGDCPPVRYEGVDLSPAALAEAAKNLKSWPSVTFQEQDMLTKAQSVPSSSFDVVYSSFAMHHLGAAEKERLFAACARLLKPGGTFLLVDILREDGETREQFLESYFRIVRAKWTAITPAQVEEIYRHVSTFDFPETFWALAEMARQSGFHDAQTLGRFDAHQVLRFA